MKKSKQKKLKYRFKRPNKWFRHSVKLPYCDCHRHMTESEEEMVDVEVDKKQEELME